jgi:gliding motility-associated protein GldM
MIGMMYLVLTAMLALNVSKEAVEAFLKVDKGLTKTIENYAVKNSTIYAAFDQKAALNATKWGPARDQALNIKQRSDELFDYIQDRKIEIITTAEGPKAPSVNGREIDVMKVVKIDENNVPSQIMVGAGGNGKANDLKNIIDLYRDDMIKIVAGKAPAIEESLKSVFSTEGGLNKELKVENWPTLTFQMLPLAAAICILSKIQVDVRNAETDVLNFLYAQIEAQSYKFNKLEAVVQYDATDIMLGMEYGATVFFSAVDTTAAPTVTVGNYSTSTNPDGSPKYEMTGDYTTLPIDEFGRGVYKVRGTALGPKTWGGLISITNPDGTTLSRPFKAKYNVNAQTAVVSPTAMNVLYQGIDNPIGISVPGIGKDKLRVTMKNGTIGPGKRKNTKGEDFPGDWLANPDIVGQNAEIIVSAEINGKQVPLPVAVFRVKNIPTPTAQFAGMSDGKVDKNNAAAQSGVNAVLEGFDFDLRYIVTEFSFNYNDKGNDFVYNSKTNLLTPDMKGAIKNFPRGKKFSFQGIKAVGPNKKIVSLNPVTVSIE